MKHLLILVLSLSFITQTTFSQDVIRKLNGEKINCKIKEITDSSIKYSIVEENYIQSISLKKVERIKLESGETEIINTKVIVNGQQDWEKVQIVYLEKDVSDFKKGNKFTVNNKRTGLITRNQKILRSNSLQDLKQLAANDGYPIVFIQKEDFTRLSGIKARRASFSIAAIGYTYN